MKFKSVSMMLLLSSFVKILPFCQENGKYPIKSQNLSTILCHGAEGKLEITKPLYNPTVGSKLWLSNLDGVVVVVDLFFILNLICYHFQNNHCFRNLSNMEWTYKYMKINSHFVIYFPKKATTLIFYQFIESHISNF